MSVSGLRRLPKASGVSVSVATRSMSTPMRAPVRSQGENCPHYPECCDAQAASAVGLVSRVTPVQTAMRNCTRDEGRSFEVGNQVLISNYRKLLWSKATVVNVAEKSEQDSGRYDLLENGARLLPGRALP